MSYDNYQYNFSSHHRVLYDAQQREQKANKIFSVLSSYLGELGNLSLLDVGCSTGIMTNLLSERFQHTTGIDIDEEGIQYAQSNFVRSNLRFLVGDCMHIGFPEDSFDVVNCSHIYEHVPDSRRLVSEIYRVLRPGGVCFFAAANRIAVKDPEYGLPFLSLLPKRIAHKYVKMFNRADFYYETFLTYWQLRKLVSDFELIDYTTKIIAEPDKYFATDMIRAGSVKQRLSLLLLRYAYWLCHTYVWLLKK
jgi:SAM-dependent methyltransferase